MAIKAEERFWAKVDKNGPLIIKSRCWVWTGCRDLRGYGRIVIGGRLMQAHRVSYEINIGTIQKLLHVCHKCDNPSCIRPRHLFLGDQSANVHDCISKKRHRYGERHYGAKLTNKQVLDIRSKSSCRGTVMHLAKEFCVSQATISRIRSGTRWKHVKVSEKASTEKDNI